MKWKFNSSFLHGLSKKKKYGKHRFKGAFDVEEMERFLNEQQIVALMVGVEVEDDEFKCLYKQIYIEATLNTFSKLCFHNFFFALVALFLLLLCLLFVASLVN